MDEKLTKAAIIENLHNKLGLNRTEIHMVIDELFEEIKDGLKDDRVIELRGFGTFEVRQRKARQGRNPRKPGEVIKIAASKAPVFKAGKALKDAVNK